MKRLDMIVNYTAVVMGVLVVFEYLVGVYLNGSFGPGSIAQNVASSTAIYVLVVSGAAALATLASGVAIAIKPLTRRLAACCMVLAVVALSLSVAYLMSADVPGGTCPIKTTSGVYTPDCGDAGGYLSSLPSSVKWLDTAAVVFGVANLYFTWKQARGTGRDRSPS
jgi:hypothetical protein